MIQKWLSVVPKPLVVEPTKEIARRNPKQTPGFLRIDSVTELQELLTKILTTEWKYVGAMVEPLKVGAMVEPLKVGAMVEPLKVGALIKSLDLSQTPEEIGREFLKRIPEASALSII